MPHFAGAAGPRDPNPSEPGAQPFDVGSQRWTAVRRHEMARLARGALKERRLTLFFFGPAGEVRRAIVPSDLPDPAPIATLHQLLADALPIESFGAG